MLTYHVSCAPQIHKRTVSSLQRRWRPTHQPACIQHRHARLVASASLQSITASPLYSTWLQSAVVLVILGAVDAAYSGDWCSSHAFFAATSQMCHIELRSSRPSPLKHRSRIGVLTTGQEQELQQLLATLAEFHVFCTVLAAAVATRRGNSWQRTCAGCLKVRAHAGKR